MTCAPHRYLLPGGLAALLLVLTPAEAGATPGHGGSAAGSEHKAADLPCRLPSPFRSDEFPDGATIDNPFLPMPPGSKKTYEGHSVAGGVSGKHTVVTIVTDLYKEVDEVQSRVILDVDLQDGEVTESELAFFAQDDDGAVWNTGEYPEEYENGTFAGAPSTWISGEDGASAGIHMPAEPTDRSALGHEYLQGVAPDIEFLDCAAVVGVNGRATVPAGTFTHVLTTFERSPLESETAIQTKEHAPGVGIVRIGAKNDPEGETLELTSVQMLSKENLEAIDARVRAMDRRAQRLDEYRSTGPLHQG